MDQTVPQLRGERDEATEQLDSIRRALHGVHYSAVADVTADLERIAELKAAEAERDLFQTALNAINDIRNSIVRRQVVNWSAHIYPLVAVLRSVGIEGDGYDSTGARAKAEIEEIKAKVFAEVTAERDAAVATAHQSDAAARAIGDDFTRVLRECSILKAGRDALKAEVEAMRAVVSTIEDFAEYDCTYGDDCPAFGARHGRCVGCKARRALDALRARKVGG